MNIPSESKTFRRFSRHLAKAGRVQINRVKSRQEVDEQLAKMRKNIIRMRLSYKDIDDLKERMHDMIYWEGMFQKIGKRDSGESEILRATIERLEHELYLEKDENRRIVQENNAKIQQLTESLESVKNKLKLMMLEKVKKHHRIKFLEEQMSGLSDK